MTASKDSQGGAEPQEDAESHQRLTSWSPGRMSYEIIPQRAADEKKIETLLDRTFGPERHQKTVYRLREGVEPLAGLCHVAVDADGQLLATLRFWPIVIGDRSTPAILFGPIAVEPSLQGKGIGRALLRHGLAEAKRQGHHLCVLVGDPDYYGPYGFENAVARRLRLPGPVEPERFQVFELTPGALSGVSGMIAPAASPPAAASGPRGARRDSAPPA